MPECPTIADFIEAKGGMLLGILTSTVMVRKALYCQVVESDPYLHQSGRFIRGDTQLWAEIAALSRVHYVPESLVTYNQTEESATRSKDITKPLRLSIATAELGIYLCDKHHLSPDVRNLAEARRWFSSLRLAFYMRNAELADEVRKKKKVLTAREWLLYHGAKNAALWYLLRSLVPFRNLTKKALSRFSEYSATITRRTGAG